MARKLTETMYIVQDLDSAIAFYSATLGCRLVRRHDWGFAFLEIESGASFSLMTKACFGNFGRENDSFGPRLCFATDDIEVEVAKLNAAGVVSTQIVGKMGENRAVNVFDADGNAIFLWEDGSGKLPDDAG
jgi:catechol 2,3-dioxygenase-like lactoylglutathione lyase family enzyme